MSWSSDHSDGSYVLKHFTFLLEKELIDQLSLPYDVPQILGSPVPQILGSPVFSSFKILSPKPDCLPGRWLRIQILGPNSYRLSHVLYWWV